MEKKGFWAGLFDLSFTEFITIRVIKVIFILAIIASVIVGLVVFGKGIAMLKFRVALGLLMIVVSPLVALLYVLLARVWLEIIVVLFRIAENTGRLVEQKEAKS
jgi:hypothetical protein